MDIKLGLYKHFKGNTYEVIGVATNTETMDDLVLYKPTYNPNKIWARPISMFFLIQ